MLANEIDRKILTVSQLNRSVKTLLETHFRIVWIEGEMSNLSRPGSGHIYFTLKDADAQVRCAMFKMRSQHLSFRLENGMHILAYAKISLYEGRGDYQLIIEHIEERGEGILRRRFELLKAKLEAEGLFALSRKQPIPAFPRCIGVVTSAAGAAIRDVLSVLKRRFSNIPVIIYPTAVQGEQAAAQIAQAIQIANSRKECDVLIVCRGGGSLEDLFAFNEEIVARSVFESNIPIVSGVGHEIDFTITDLVADYRAPTPSAAAELLSPNKQEYCEKIHSLSLRIASYLCTQIKHTKIQIENYLARFLRPEHLIMRHNQTLDLQEQALLKCLQARLELEDRKLQLVQLKLAHLNPTNQFQINHTHLKTQCQRLRELINSKLREAAQQLAYKSKGLHTVSPLNTLERGYSITTQNGAVIDELAKVNQQDAIKVEIKDGYLFCNIEYCQSK